LSIWKCWRLRDCQLSHQERGALLFKQPLEHFAQILQQMDQIGNRDGVGRSACRTISILMRAVTADDFATGMLFAPVGQRVGRAIGQQINRLMTFKVDQDRAKDLAFAQREVIDAQHAWCRCRWRRVTTSEATQGGWADRHALALGETCASLATNIQSQSALFGTEAGSATRTGSSAIRQAFAEGLL
jgi:hypothetical protein